MKYYSSKARQAGMTLIELTVVLLVLIGLAGLMIPYVGGFVSKTHDSVNSDSLYAVNSAIQRYDVQFMGHPDNYDSLITTTTNTASTSNGNIYTKMMGGLGTNDYLKEVAIDGKAFVDIGISNLKQMDNGTSDATFAATNGDIALSAGTNQSFAAINVKGTACTMGTDAMGCIPDDAALSKILGRKVNTSAFDYVLFGVGQDSAMIGKTIAEAPVHFAKTGAMSAKNKYNRILAVYAVPKANVCLDANNQAVTSFYAAGATTTTAVNNMATCTSAATGYNVPETNPGDQAAAGTIGSTTWTGSTQKPAQFLTTVMPMMKLEGLGGALASHYASVANQ
ncbi:type II secretion system protein [methane-oxidizing endosymbiont of Gigantopelta aegis]|uniref:type II secretion system protein n=1 Tax=methane-oxidizing endosymbiont of Gigantopelta aegis TaxID=2794938 RepID=UPI0018DDFBB6|nr:type II secretion system protein [methane-oxidizing endosymbiont of Gigantopelta aegis]